MHDEQKRPDDPVEQVRAKEHPHPGPPPALDVPEQPVSGMPPMMPQPSSPPHHTRFRWSILLGIGLPVLVILFSIFYVYTRGIDARDYSIGKDSVPAITELVGERPVFSYATHNNNGSITKEYTYSSDTVIEDVTAYTEHLVEKGFVFTEHWSPQPDAAGVVNLGKSSSDARHVVLLTIEYEPGSYSIYFHKTPGYLSDYT